MTPHPYTYYQSALLGSFGPVHENDPQCGYYRMRRGRGGPWVPAAIWREGPSSSDDSTNSDSGKLVCLVDGYEQDPFDVWTWVCRYPVPYEVYVSVAEEGKPWPEDLPDLKKARSGTSVSPPETNSSSLEQISSPAQLPSGSLSPASSSPVPLSLDAPALTPLPSAASSSIPLSRIPPSPTQAPPAPMSGHNSEGVDEAEMYLEEIEALALSANEWLEEVGSIGSQVLADKAANYAERFGNLENRAEEARTLLKKPVLDQGRSIDSKWKPIVTKALENKVRLKKVLEPYLLAQYKRHKELGLETDPPRAGTHGRRIGLKSRWILKITSQSDLQSHYQSDPRLWADKSVREVLTKLAETDLAANQVIQGAELIEELTAV